ncbi:MAG: radical SAM protein [Candidatus Omnitrophota bacterium]
MKTHLWDSLVKVLGGVVAAHYLKKPSFAYIISTRYPSASSFFLDSLNQLMMRMGSVRTFPLTTVTFELTNVCNLKCSICPVNSGMKRERGLFPLEEYKRIIDSNPRIKRVGLVNWGEPLLHPEFIEFIRYASSKGIHTSTTTNAVLLDEGQCKSIMNSGLDIMRFSLDAVGYEYEKIRGFDYRTVKQNIERFIEYRNRNKPQMKIEITAVIGKDNEASISALKEEWQGRVDFINFQPMLLFTKYSRRQACRELWRSLYVLVDGTVIPCCADYEGLLNVGNAFRQDLRKIWNGVAIRQLRQAHLAKKFDATCAACAEFSSNKIESRFQ